MLVYRAGDARRPLGTRSVVDARTGSPWPTLRERILPRLTYPAELSLDATTLHVLSRQFIHGHNLELVDLAGQNVCWVDDD